MKPVRSKSASTVVNPARGRRLLLLLLGAAMLFVLTLPWQMHQWAETKRFNEQAEVQEVRAEKLRQAKIGAAPSTSNTVSGPSDDLSARLQAVTAHVVRTRSGKESVAAAAREIQGMESDANRSAHVADTLADLYQQIGYVDRAVAMARLSERLAPNAPGPLLRLGYIELALGHPKSSLNYFQRASKRAVDKAEPHIALALAHDLDSDLPAAEQELRTAVRLDSKNWRAALLLAQNLTHQGKYDEVETLLSKTLPLASDEPQFYVVQATFLLERAEKQGLTDASGADIIGAKRAVEHALLLDPNNLDAHFLLGRIHAMSGANAEALREWEQVLAVRPTYPKLRVTMGRLLTQTGDKARGQTLLQGDKRDTADAAEYNRLVIRSGDDPENVSYRRDLARWSMQHGKVSRAILEWQEILARRPADQEASEQIKAAMARRDAS